MGIPFYINFKVVAFALPNLLCWVVIFPGFLLFQIVKSRDTLDSIDTRSKWGYFYNEYKLGAYFWEFVKIF